MIKIKTVSDLKRVYQEKHPDGHFFDKETMKFWGCRMSDMRITGVASISDYRGNKHNCYCVSSRRKDYYGNYVTDMYYFDTETLDLVYT